MFGADKTGIRLFASDVLFHCFSLKTLSMSRYKPPDQPLRNAVWLSNNLEGDESGANIYIYIYIYIYVLLRCF
jgi:hypothetical protein